MLIGCRYVDEENMVIRWQISTAALVEPERAGNRAEVATTSHVNGLCCRYDGGRQPWSVCIARTMASRVNVGTCGLAAPAFEPPELAVPPPSLDIVGTGR